MSDCETWETSISALADGELSDAEAERLRAAMAADPSLARRYELYAASRRVLRQAFAQLDELPASPRLLASLRREQAVTLAPRVAPRRAVFALAAGLLLTVGLAAWFGQQAQRSHDASVGTQLAREAGAVAAALEHLAAGEEAHRPVAIPGEGGLNDREVERERADVEGGKSHYVIVGCMSAAKCTFPAR